MEKIKNLSMIWQRFINASASEKTFDPLQFFPADTSGKEKQSEIADDHDENLKKYFG